MWSAAFLLIAGLIVTSAAPWIAVANAAILAGIVWALRPRSLAARMTGDVLPLLVATAVAYGEVPALVASLGSRYHDATIQAWELLVFGGQPAHSLAGALPGLWLSELLHGGYMAFYVAVFLPPLLLYIRREQKGFAETVLTATVTWIICCAFFAVFPVQGPRYVWSAPPGIIEGPLRRTSLALLSAGSARGAAFPSLHMAASVSQTIMAWRWHRGAVRWLVTAVTLLVGVGAVYAGYHYALDMVAGALVGAGTALLAIRLARTKRGPVV